MTSVFKVAKGPNEINSAVGSATVTSSEVETGFTFAAGVDKMLGHRVRFKLTMHVFSSGTYQNNNIRVNEGGGDVDVPMLTGQRTGTAHAAMVASQLNAAGGLANSYVSSFDDATGLFTIATSPGANFDLIWSTAPNSVGPDMGFDATDDTGAQTYTSDSAVTNMGHHVKMIFSGVEDLRLIAVERFRHALVDGSTGQLTLKPADLRIVHYGHSSDLGNYWRDWDDTATTVSSTSCSRLGDTPENELFVEFIDSPSKFTHHYISFQEVAPLTPTERMYPWLEIGYMFAGTVYDTDAGQTRTYAAAFERHLVQPITKSTLHANSINSSALPMHNLITLNFDSFPTATWKIVQEVYEDYGQGEPAVFLLEPGTGSQNDGYSAYYANIDRDVPLDMQINDLASLDLVLREQRADDG